MGIRLGARVVALAVFTAAGGALGLAGQVPVTQAPGQLPSAPAEGTAAISGVVLDTAGRPIGGAIVALAGAGRGANAPARQVTDAKGRFVFTRLPPGSNYSVTAAKQGYLGNSYGLEPGQSRVASRRIELKDGQWANDIRIALAHPGAISGTVSDEFGEPVVGAYVRVLAQIMVAGRPQVAAGPATKTDDRGMYRIADLSPGRYVVVVPSVQSAVPAGTSDALLSGQTPERVASAEAAGRPLAHTRDAVVAVGSDRLVIGPLSLPPPPATAGRRQAYPIVFYPAARALGDASPVDVPLDQERAGVDIHLAPVPVVRVAGRVVAPEDLGKDPLTLRLLPPGCESLGDSSDAASALAAPDGSFAFLDVPAGTYTLLASRSVMEYTYGNTSSRLPALPGRTMNSSGGGTVSAATPGTNYSYSNERGSNLFTGRQTVTVGQTDISDLTVPLARAVTISGRAVWEGTPPSTGGPSLGRPVYADPANGDASLGMATGRMTESGGTYTFSIEGLQQGGYVLRFLGGGVVKSITWNGEDYTYRPFDGSLGRDFSDVLVTFASGTGTVTGLARDAGGAPAEHAGVLVFPADPREWTDYGFRPAKIVERSASSAGRYSIDLPGGDYNIIAIDESLMNQWQDPKFLEAAAASAMKVSIDWGASSTVDLAVQPVRWRRQP